MRLSDFDYNYPEELIAAHPLPDRDASKMMVLDRSEKIIVHSMARELPKYLKSGDVVVINNTKVFPARLVGEKESGGYFEVLLLSSSDVNKWRCITNQTKASKPGLKVKFGLKLVGTVISREGDEIVIEFNKPELIEKVGLPPLPPYIRKKREEYFYDKERYQTIYARHVGSAAAPTAGLHFTDKLLQQIKDIGVNVATVTLHVGLDTFAPVRTDNIDDHRMHGEEYFVPPETVEAIKQAKNNGGRIVAIGTTSVRALESTEMGITHLFITPGYKFQVVDCILTNFHQPKSTLLMLVSAFADREFILQAYKEAIENRYRLFSYGDCMLII